MSPRVISSDATNSTSSERPYMGDIGLKPASPPVQILWHLKDKLPKAIRDIHAMGGGVQIVLLDDNPFTLSKTRKELEYVYPRAQGCSVSCANTQEDAEKLLKEARLTGKPVVFVTDLYMQDVVKGEIKGQNGDDVLRDFSKNGLLDGVGVLVHTRSCTQSWSEPLYQHIADCDNEMQMRDTIREVEDSRDGGDIKFQKGIPFTQVRKYKDLRRLMYAIDAMVIKAQVMDPHLMREYFESYTPTKEKTSAREDAAIKINDLAGIIFLTLNEVAPRMKKLQQTLPKPELFKDDEGKWAAEDRIDDAELFFIDLEKYSRRYTKRDDLEYICVRNILGKPLNMNHEIFGGLSGLERAQRLLGDDELKETHQRISLLVSKFFKDLDKKATNEANLPELLGGYENEGVKVAFEGDMREYIAVGDPEILAISVFNELIGNAKKMALVNSRPQNISLSSKMVDYEVMPEPAKKQLQKGHKYIEITCEDQSGGISPENLGKIFDLGWTTHGTGMGLHILRQTVRQDNLGEVTVESQEGKGSRFKVYLMKKEQPQ